MTIQQLADALARLMNADPANASATILFDGKGAVEGGILVRDGDSPLLILAPIRLDQVGGF